MAHFVTKMGFRAGSALLGTALEAIQEGADGGMLLLHISDEIAFGRSFQPLKALAVGESGGQMAGMVHENACRGPERLGCLEREFRT